MHPIPQREGRTKNQRSGGHHANSGNRKKNSRQKIGNPNRNAIKSRCKHATKKPWETPDPNPPTPHQNDPAPLVLQCQTSADSDNALVFVPVFPSTPKGLKMSDHSEALFGNGWFPNASCGGSARSSTCVLNPSSRSFNSRTTASYCGSA